MNKKLLVLLVVVIAFAIGFWYYDDMDGNSEIKSFATGHYFNSLSEYSFSSFLPMECRYVNEMYVKYEGSATFGNVAFDGTPTFNPKIQFDLTNRNDGRVIDQIRIDFNQKCTITGGSSWTDGLTGIKTTGSALLQLGSGSLGEDLGNEFTSFVSIPVSKTVQNDVWTVIASKTYTNFQQYETDMILHNDVNAWIKAFGQMQLDYELRYTDSSSNFNAGGTNGVGSLFTVSAWLVRADANVITPPEPNANTSNEPIFLDDVTTTLTASQGGQDGTIDSSNPLDTNKQSGRQLLIEGTVRKWLNTEGLPTIKITDASGVSLIDGTMLFNTKSGDDGKFVFYYSMPFQSQNGAYTISMEHPNRFQGDFSTPQKSSKVIIVENSATVTSTGSTDNDDGSTITNTSTGTVKSFFGNICLAWTALYISGESQNGLICDETFDVDLGSALSLANSVQGENVLLKSIQVSPILQFKTDAITSQFTIESSDVTFDTSIDIAGTEVTLDTRNTILFSPTRALCVDTEQGTTCANKGFSLGSVILGTDALTNKIETAQRIQDLPNGGTAPLSIVVDISGTFTARNDDTGKAYSGSTDGTVFTWDTTYVKGELGQQIVIVTDDDGEESVIVTDDDNESDSANPEKPILDEDDSDTPVPPGVDQGCGFEDDDWYYINETCDDLQVFFQEVRDLKDGTCHSKDFPDSDGILREVVACAELDQNIGTGGASGSAGGGLNNGDDDEPGGLLGLGGLCEGTVIQCAEAFTQNIDDKLKDRIGLDSVELGLVLGGGIFLLIVIGALVGIAKRRNNSYNPMNYR